jgi:PIN domain nuclease of toxin-antitoxin system
VNVLLDTCAILWTVSEPERLSDDAKSTLLRKETRVHVSPISCAEIACLAERGRIRTEPHWRTWFDNAIRSNGWRVLDIDLSTVQEAFSLPGVFHADPADRLIVGAARLGQLAVITADRKILGYPHVRTIW